MAKQLKMWAGLGVALLAGSSVGDAAALHVGGPAQANSLLYFAAAAGEGDDGGAKVADDQIQFEADLAEFDALSYTVAALAGERQSKGVAAAFKDAQALELKMKPQFKARHMAGLDSELARLGKLISTPANAAKVTAAVQAIKKRVTEKRGKGEDVSAHVMTSAVLILLRKAVDEYAAGFGGKTVTDARRFEYSHGLVLAAKSIMTDLTRQERDEHHDPLIEIDAALTSLDALWPPVGVAVGDSHLLAVAAAKVELAGLAIK